MEGNPTHVAMYKAGILNRPLTWIKAALDRAGVDNNIPEALPSPKRPKRVRRNDAARRS